VSIDAREPNGMADLHSHLLPGVDDGAKSLEVAGRVLGVMLGERITDVCLTPHMSVLELVPPAREDLLERHDAAYAGLLAVGLPIPRCHRGIELMVDRPLPLGACIDRRITLAGSRYVLIEFPRTLSSAAIRGLIGEVRETGFVPMIAHPERYSVATPEEVFQWRDFGAAIQVDATTLAAGRGPRATRARAIVEAGLADVLAADNHGDARTLAEAWRFLEAVGGEAQADYLLRQNPAAVLADQALEAVPPMRFRKRRFSRIIRFLRS
jgi:protein-tyrosine phosphatase